MDRRVSAVHAGLLAKASAVVVAVCRLLSKMTRNPQENSKNNWHVNHPAGQCTNALAGTLLAAREVSLDTLHRGSCTGHNGNRNVMVPAYQGLLTAAAAVSAANDVSTAAAADAARGAVKPIAADDSDDAALGAVKPTAANDSEDAALWAVKSTAADDDSDDAALGFVKPVAAADDDGLFRRPCRDHLHPGLCEPLWHRRRAPGRCLTA